MLHSPQTSNGNLSTSGTIPKRPPVVHFPPGSSFKNQPASENILINLDNLSSPRVIYSPPNLNRTLLQSEQPLVVSYPPESSLTNQTSLENNSVNLGTLSLPEVIRSPPATLIQIALNP